MILSKVKRKSQTFHDPELVECSVQLKDYSERKADTGSRRRHMNILLKVAHITETAMELLWLLDEDVEYRTHFRRSSRRSSNSDDIEIMEEESNDPPARSRASRILSPIERLFRRRDRDRRSGRSGRRRRMKDRPTQKLVLLLGRTGKK